MDLEDSSIGQSHDYTTLHEMPRQADACQTLACSDAKRGEYVSSIILKSTYAKRFIAYYTLLYPINAAILLE